MICVFTGGKSPEPKACERFFLDFFENLSQQEIRGEIRQKPKIPAVAADSGILAFEKFQNHFGFFELKKILGDFDSLCDRRILGKYPKSLIENFPEDKDFSDTELALGFALKNFPERRRVLLGAGGGGRLDHFLAVFDLFSEPIFPRAWLCPQQFLRLLTDGDSVEVGNLGIGDYVSVFRANGPRNSGKIESSGLEWESGVFRKSGVPSLSNRISKEFFERGEKVKIRCADGNFVLVLPPSASVKIHPKKPSETMLMEREMSESATAAANTATNASE